MFWRRCRVLLLVMGAIAVATAVGLRTRGRPWRVPLLYGTVAVGSGPALEVVVR